MPDEIRGLTLTEPWAMLVACGATTVETRSWGTAYRGLLAIHAGVTFSGWARDYCDDEPFRSALLAAGMPTHREHDYDWINRSRLPRGVILAVATLYDSVQIPNVQYAQSYSAQERAFGDFEPGRWAWKLRDVRRLAEPIPHVGQLRLWRLSDDATERLRQAGYLGPARS